jgi:YidC/Oxa1 family membrane protein insertase
MDKQTTLAFVLIGIVLVVWLYLTAPKPEIENNQQTDSTTVVIDTLKKPVLKSDQEVNIKPEKPDTSLSNNRIINQNINEDTNEEITTVENDVFIVEFSNKGGNIHKVFLKKFKNWYSINDNNEEDYYKTCVQLINYSKGNAYDLSFVSVDGKAINTSDYFFKSNIPSGTYQVSGDDSLKLEFSLKIEE